MAPAEVITFHSTSKLERKMNMMINPPPADNRCEVCRRHISQLMAFGGPGDPLVGDFSGAKLVKHWREYYPGYVKPSWECRDCIGRDGGLWELELEDERGRPLSDSERHELRYEMLVGLHEANLERRLTATEREELRTQLDGWEPGEWISREPEPAQGIAVTLNEQELRLVERQMEDLAASRRRRS